MEADTGKWGAATLTEHPDSSSKSSAGIAEAFLHLRDSRRAPAKDAGHFLLRLRCGTQSRPTTGADDHSQPEQVADGEAAGHYESSSCSANRVSSRASPPIALTS
jgi:hypothetical protein